MVVFAEHRYYGLSNPFGPNPAAAVSKGYNVSFLTVEQALEDFNQLNVQMRIDYDMPAETAFVAFGGSYGGNLAMWLRLKYPSMWAGAIASSATPLKHLLRETNGFAKIETEAYANVSSRCPDLVRQGWSDLFSMARTAKGRQALGKALGLCGATRRRGRGTVTRVVVVASCSAAHDRARALSGATRRRWRGTVSTRRRRRVLFRRPLSLLMDNRGTRGRRVVSCHVSRRYGANTLSVGSGSFRELLVARFCAPFAVFQVGRAMVFVFCFW